VLSLIVVQLRAPDSRITPLLVETCSHLSHLQVQLDPREEITLFTSSHRVLVPSNYLLLRRLVSTTNEHPLVSVS
jgi:hypothetical protein